jgi:succinoglycan biosynthesis transport protein ExoP
MLRTIGNSDGTDLVPVSGQATGIVSHITTGNADGASAPGPIGTMAAPLVDVLWQRRWVVIGTVGACLFLGIVYLLLATPKFTSTARVQVQQNAPKLLSDGRDPGPASENYIETQVSVIESTQVLARALDKIGYANLATFANADGDPVEWMRESGALLVEPGRKSDIVNVSVESINATEAADIANAIVNAYIVEQALQMRSTGSEMVSILQKERDDLQKKRDAVVQQMLTSGRRSGVVAHVGDKGNTAIERMASLASSLTSSEIETIELKSRQDSVRAVLATPASVSAFAASQQARGNDGNADREYGELRNQLAQYTLALSNARAVQGEGNRRVQALQTSVNSLKELIAAKERSIVEGELALIGAQLTSAEEKQKQLRAALASQRELALDQSPEAAEYRRLEMEADRLARQCEVIDGRIAEIRVNTVEASPMTVAVIEPARAAGGPAKPKKMMTLAACIMAGSVLGIGAAMLREWQDARLRTPEEIRAVLGTQVIAMIPRINPQFSPVTRGQLVRLDARSPAAEGYRSVRTLLQLGSASAARTILIASPTSGDGKSTTASNLAIAMAQSGERVLLLDCDLRQPVQHLIFEVDSDAGISSVLADEATLRDAISATAVPGLFILPAGPVPQNPSELLTGKRFATLMQSLGKSFDRIVIDSPPLMNVTDARILAASADATILVLRMNRSMRRLGVLALDGLERVGANVLGALANDVPLPGSYDDHTYYGSVMQYEGDTKRMLSLAQSGPRPSGKATGNRPAPPDAPTQPVVTIYEPDWSNSTDRRSGAVASDNIKANGVGHGYAVATTVATTDRSGADV